MSDGNINRQLLPHTPFHSGLSTGRMQMKVRAEAAFRDILENHFPTLTPQDKELLLVEFLNKIKS